MALTSKRTMDALGVAGWAQRAQAYTKVKDAILSKRELIIRFYAYDPGGVQKTDMAAVPGQGSSWRIARPYNKTDVPQGIVRQDQCRAHSGCRRHPLRIA